MKYTILINQYAAVRAGLDLDIIDLAIFDFIKDFANSSNCMKVQTPQGIFFWISHKLIMESMPLLKIKTSQGLTKRIDNLIKAGIIKKHPECDKYSKTLYSFGSNYDLLSFMPSSDVYTAMPLNESYTPPTKVVPPLNESLGVPLNESWGNNNINNNNRNNLLEKEVEEKFISSTLGITAKSIDVDPKVFKKIDTLLSKVVFPFDDAEFKKRFFVLCCMPKWRTKTIHAIQMQLKKLQEYELKFVMDLLDSSIMNGWQGIIYSDTPRKYQEWLRSNSIKMETKEIERVKENEIRYLDKNSKLWD
jgi:hypothetical protein